MPCIEPNLKIDERRKYFSSESKSDFVGNFVLSEEFRFFRIHFLENFEGHGVFGGADRVDQQLKDLETRLERGRGGMGTRDTFCSY